jgi:hypothetical protein
MATATKDEEKKETVKGYAGPVEENPPVPKDAPEGTVVSPAGVTKPPEVYVSDPYRKEATKDERLYGKVLMKGKTFRGYEYEQIIELTMAQTKEGAFNTFKGHHGDAVPEGFSAKMVSDEEAEKLTKQWSKELQGKQTDEDKARKER